MYLSLGFYCCHLQYLTKGIVHRHQYFHGQQNIAVSNKNCRDVVDFVAFSI